MPYPHATRLRRSKRENRIKILLFLKSNESKIFKLKYSDCGREIFYNFHCPVFLKRGIVILMDDTKVRNYCLRLLKFRPRSRKEVEQRLKRKKYPPDLIDKAVAELVEAGLINDKEFVRFWVNWRNEVNPRSQNFIKLELRQKGISADLIEKILEPATAEAESIKAKELARKQYQRLKNLKPEKIKRRIYGYLQRRGFVGDIIFDVIGKLVKNG